MNKEKEELISNTDEETVKEKETITSEETANEKESKTEEEIAKEKKLAKKQKRRNIFSNVFFAFSLIFLLTATYKFVTLEEGENITILGYQPVVILTDSMDPEIKKYGIALLKTTENPSETVEVGDTIAYTITDSEGEKNIVHEVVEITEEGYQTQGVANSSPDPYIVTEDMIYAEVVASTNILNTIYYHFAEFLFLTGTLIMVIVIVKMRKATKREKALLKEQEENNTEI